MGPTIIVGLFLIGGVILGWTIAQTRSKPVLDKRDKLDLDRLRKLENRLTTLCMQNSSDSFAYIILDEIVTSRNRTPGRKDLS